MQRLIIIGLLLCCCGCGKSDGVKRGAVSGIVTLDGVEIAEGSIAFYPSGNTKGPASGGLVKGGRYSIAIDKGPVIGSNRVEIHASKRTGRKVQAPMSDPGVMTDERIEAIPGRYNTKSSLVAEIESDENVFNCELISK